MRTHRERLHRDERQESERSDRHESHQDACDYFIAVGDYNFDWDVTNGESMHDQGCDLLTADGVFA